MRWTHVVGGCAGRGVGKSASHATAFRFFQSVPNDFGTSAARAESDSFSSNLPLCEGSANDLAKVWITKREEITQFPQSQIRPGSKVLYADDWSVARRQIETVLFRLGGSFVGAKTGKEAWKRLKALAQEARTAGVQIREKVWVGLTDLDMPEMDGFTLTRQMKEDDVLKTAPVVICSSLSRSTDESHANLSGANGYVAKFAPDEPAREVTKALTGHSA